MKSTLWALAFACAAVSCSDDFEEPNNGGKDPGLNGETAKMRVVIQTETTTKASDDPEEGDKNDNNEYGEIGSKEESEVKDLTVFLFTDGDASSADVIDFTASSSIVAAGYTAVDKTSGTDHPSNHGWEAEVQVQVNEATEDVTLAGNTFGVIAVTNYGSKVLSENDKITTGKALADMLQTSIYTTKGFVMSTHMLEDESNHKSEIEFPAATAADQDIPTVEVFVERLAAKVRINPDETNGYSFGITVNGTANTDKVVLDQAAVLNQLTSGSYLLKRATSKADASLLTELDLTAAVADVYLEDEAYDENTSNAKLNKANFVIDPWTRLKNSENVFVTNEQTGVQTVTMPTSSAFTKLDTEAGKALAYGNYLVGDFQNGSTTDANFKTYEDWYAALPTETSPSFATKQLQAKALTGTEALTLAYTMENTTNVANSLNGFSTGVLFKATYYAKQTVQIADNNKSVDAKDTEWGADNTAETPDLTFYTYGSKELKFASLEAIFAYTLAAQVENITGTDVAGYYFYDSFMADEQGTSTAFDAITVSAFKASKTYTEDRVDDVFGYMAYLKESVKDADDATTFGDLTVDGGELKTFTAYIKDLADEKKFASVKSYVDGECYYLYWIRHENNGLNNYAGPMEFDIVRNNIYDLTVTGISGLGLSGIEVPKPTDPDEDGTAKMNVLVKVKNWVVRNNGDIIL